MDFLSLSIYSTPPSSTTTAPISRRVGARSQTGLETPVDVLGARIGSSVDALAQHGARRARRWAMRRESMIRVEVPDRSLSKVHPYPW